MHIRTTTTTTTHFHTHRVSYQDLPNNWFLVWPCLVSFRFATNPLHYGYIHTIAKASCQVDNPSLPQKLGKLVQRRRLRKVSKPHLILCRMCTFTTWPTGIWVGGHNFLVWLVVETGKINAAWNQTLAVLLLSNPRQWQTRTCIQKSQVFLWAD